MKKVNMTKLALMGLASGLLMSAQVSANDVEEILVNSEGTELARSGCGNGKCGGSSADNARTRRSNPYRSESNSSHKAGCNGKNGCEGKGHCNGKKMNGTDKDHCNGKAGCEGNGSCNGKKMNGTDKGSCNGKGGCSGAGGCNGAMKNKRNGMMKK